MFILLTILAIFSILTLDTFINHFTDFISDLANFICIFLVSAIIIFFLSRNSLADGFVNYGTGVGKSATSHVGEVKTVGLGFTNEYSSFLHYKGEAGLWVDTIKNGRKSSGYASISPGLDIVGRPFTLSSYHGLGIVGTKDAYLGSNIQFFHDVCAGVKHDFSSSSISMCYKHISNANVFPGPNVGRDFIYVKLSF